MSMLSRALVVGLLFTVGTLSTDALLAKDIFRDIDRVVAVGDLHGDYGQYINVLKTNGLVDEKLKWQGGKTHFVQLGDVVDRGPDSLKIIRHLMKLEKQAKRSGGRVHVLIGNHEAMNIQADLRYVHPGEYAALVTRRSEAEQARYLDLVFQHRASFDPALETMRDDVMEQLKNEFPLGYVEHRKLWEPGRELAKWVAKHNTVVQIDDSLFIHGGLNPHVEPEKLSSINRQMRKELSNVLEGDGISNTPEGPLWYRGLAEHAEELELGPLIAMLDFYGAKRIFVAHTPTEGAVLTRFDGRVVMIDVGIAAHYGSNLANVVIEEGRLQVMHRGTLVPFPENDASLREYLELVASHEPAGSRLSTYVENMDRQPSGVEEKKEAVGDN